ncbi:MAG: 50S ribosomal protein L4 [Thermoleophilia bacterium]
MPDKEEEIKEAEDTAAKVEAEAVEPEDAAAADSEPEAVAVAEAEPEAEATEGAVDEDVAVEATAPAKESKPKAESKARKPAKKKAAPKKAKKAPRTDVKVPEVKALAGKELKLNPEVFEVEAKIGVIHEVVRAEMAARRKGTASTKNRAEVRGGGVKPWRQKGTGRARAGSSRIPHWTGGGVTFGPTPRSYTFKINRKMRTKAMKMALSARVREGNLRVLEGLTFDEPKAAAAAALLKTLDVTYPLLLVVGENDANVALSFRNLPRVGVTDTDDLEVSDIIGARTVLTTSQVIEQLNTIGEGK